MHQKKIFAAPGRLRTAVDVAREVWLQSPRVRHSVWLLLAMELVVALVLPGVVPAGVYLPLYLNDDRAAPSVVNFFDGKGYLVPDPVAGWMNRPNVHQGAWNTDAFGARGDAGIEPERNAKLRLMFLGSSKINGGTGVSSEEMISAYLDGANVETINFGTMLYGSDQSYLAYRAHYARFNPDVVVLGLDATPDEPLTNVYVPLRRRSEVLMPYVKPRFEMGPGGLQAIDPPLEQLKASNHSPDSLLNVLAERDGFYDEFETFQRLSFTPLAYGLSRAFGKAAALARYLQQGPSEREELLLAVLEEFRADLSTQGKSLVLLLLPDADAVNTQVSWMPALHQHQHLRGLLEGAQFGIVDARDALRNSGAPRIFHADGVHYTKEGNRIIAESLSEYLVGHGPRAAREALQLKSARVKP